MATSVLDGHLNAACGYDSDDSAASDVSAVADAAGAFEVPAAAGTHIGSLPITVLRHILLAMQSDNLLRYVSTCARVCREWRWVVVGSPAYGRGMGGVERRRVLTRITKALERSGITLHPGGLGGTPGAATFAAALQAVPRTRFRKLSMVRSDLTARGAALLAPALGRQWGAHGLRKLNLGDNPSLGDAGVKALVKALPTTLKELHFDNTSCGDDGLVALAAQLPRLANLELLQLSSNATAGPAGFVAIAFALPSLPQLRQFVAWGCRRLGSEGATALAAAVPQCPSLTRLDLSLCALGWEARMDLQRVARPGLTIDLKGDVKAR